MRTVSSALAVGVIAGLVVALVSDRRAVSDSSATTTAEVDNPINPFVLADPGPGAIPFDQLTPDEQADVEQAAQLTETNSGAGVQAALARVTAAEASRARDEIAARSLGMQGADQEGVVP